MQAQVLLTFLAVSASISNSVYKGRTFLSTYPSSTFPLSNRLKAPTSIIKLRKLRKDVSNNEDIFAKDTTEAGEIGDQEKLEVRDDKDWIEETTTNINIGIEVTTNPMDIATFENLTFMETQTKEAQAARNEKSLINQLPFLHLRLTNHHGTHDHQESHHHHHDHPEASADDRSVLANDRATDILDQLSTATADSSGRKCVDKVMMREETEYDEILTCDHSYNKRCHTSYVTKYEPHQEQECDEKFKKVCTIEYEQKAVQEVVEVCITPFVKDCDIEGDEVCQTVYESECSTVQIVHQVTDDVANCRTIEERKCKDVTEGFKTVNKCDTWPVEKCSLEKKLVKKYTPQTSCQKVPKQMCSPKGCGVKEGPVQCQDKVKTVLVDSPLEQCDMEPLRTCKHITKLVPKLEAAQDCVDVPKEICARSKVNPRKVKKPSIQKWCFTPKDAGDAQCHQDRDCHVAGRICEDNLCVLGCRENSQCPTGNICTSSRCTPGCTTDDDCPSGHSCSLNKCRVAAGKVLLGSFTISTESCTGCSQEDEGVKLTLQGERTVDYMTGYPCTTSAQSPLDHSQVDDFGSGKVARFDGSSAVEQGMMGDCFKAPLNGLVRGGSLVWVGEGVWTPSSICVDWQSNNYAYNCQVEKVPNREAAWQIVHCKEEDVKQKCDQA